MILVVKTDYLTFAPVFLLDRGVLYMRQGLNIHEYIKLNGYNSKQTLYFSTCFFMILVVNSYYLTFAPVFLLDRGVLYVRHGLNIHEYIKLNGYNSKQPLHFFMCFL